MRRTRRMLLVVAVGMLTVSTIQTVESADDVDSKGKLVLVKDGKDPIPIIVFKDAPPFIKRAANELGDYIEKISGAKPEVIEGEPKPLPKHAIWVGYQPVLKKLFPKTDFDFKHPEEILIAANENNLAIVGRDKYDPKNLVVEGRRKTIVGKQLEYGTCNAVYTFLQDYLDVRWLWPGKAGEDVVKKKTIAFAPFVFRYHPQVLSRAGLFPYSQLGNGGRAGDWARRQRIQLDSFEIPAGHAYSKWWDRFHEKHPDYFALQPDGTRCGWPGPRVAKLCQSNPAVWDQWLACVEEQLAKDPNRTVFSISPNDAPNDGVCTCEKCRAWDCLEADVCLYNWQGMGQEYVTMSDRYQKFASKLGAKLKERFPDKNYQMLLHAYGKASLFPPVKGESLDNLIISYVGKFPWGDEKRRQEDKKRIKKWMEKGASKIIYRPNVSRQPGLPEVFLKRTIEDFKFLAEQHYIGIFVDMIWEHWATCGPQYYLMAQLVWDPKKNGWAVLDDYYQRGFGPAADEIKAYWTLFDEARAAYMKKEDKEPYSAPYTMETLDKAGKLLDQAATNVAGQPKYEERVAFLRHGLDFSKLIVENYELMKKVRNSDGQDKAAAEAARKNWEKIAGYTSNKRDAKRPMALNWVFLRPGPNPYTRNLHPDFPYGPKIEPKDENAKKDIKLETPKEGGWTLAFSDDFKRQELGPDWTVVEGLWVLKNDALRGSGIVISNKQFTDGNEPVCQRLEFEIVTDVKQALFLKGRDLKIDLCDMSSFIQVEPPGAEKKNTMFSGYFFQFGGMHNKLNRIVKGKADCVRDADPSIRILPDHRFKIVVENDEGHLRQFVDGKLLQEYDDRSPLEATKGHASVGFYLYTACEISNVKVYVKPAKEQ